MKIRERCFPDGHSQGSQEPLDWLQLHTHIFNIYIYTYIYIYPLNSSSFHILHFLAPSMSVCVKLIKPSDMTLGPDRPPAVARQSELRLLRSCDALGAQRWKLPGGAWKSVELPTISVCTWGLRPRPKWPKGPIFSGMNIEHQESTNQKYGFSGRKIGNPPGLWARMSQHLDQGYAAGLRHWTFQHWSQPLHFRRYAVIWHPLAWAWISRTQKISGRPSPWNFRHRTLLFGKTIMSICPKMKLAKNSSHRNSHSRKTLRFHFPIHLGFNRCCFPGLSCRSDRIWVPGWPRLGRSPGVPGDPRTPRRPGSSANGWWRRLWPFSNAETGRPGVKERMSQLQRLVTIKIAVP